MIWHLLWLYPLIGAAIAPWLYKGESKRDRFGGNPDRVAMVLAVIILWPALMFVVPSEWKDSDTYWTERKDSEMEALLESVRQERLAPDPRLAEFDILLGIEPEPAEEAEEVTAPDNYVTQIVPGFSMSTRHLKPALSHSPPYANYEKPIDFFRDEVRFRVRPPVTEPFRLQDLREPFSWETAITDEWDLRGADLTKAYSRLAFSAGGHIPTITELNQGVDFTEYME